MYNTLENRRVLLSGSPSLGFNNLSYDGHNFVYAQGDEVYLADPSVSEATIASSPTSYRDAASVMQAKFVNVGQRPLLVLTTLFGAQIWNADGSRMLFFLPASSGRPVPADQQSFFRGIALVRSEDQREQICVGTSAGDVLVITVDSGNFSLADTLSVHESSITDLAFSSTGRRPFLASSDDTGHISVWSTPNADGFKHKGMLRGPTCLISSLCAMDNMVIAGYASGHIRIFDTSAMVIQVEIAAHVRSINALALHPSKPLLASVAEDTVVNVWSLPTADSPDVALLFAAAVPDQLLTGVTFWGPTHDNLAVSSYDVDHIRVWTSL
eukprot:GILK01001612.1.p1 GENE.GILK01001612.1~~GILK01001612.1.p1  ORF type:complete len:337 (-),score=44.81 GILK01001612.1:145-1122(-)